MGIQGEGATGEVAGISLNRKFNLFLLLPIPLRDGQADVQIQKEGD